MIEPTIKPAPVTGNGTSAKSAAIGSIYADTVSIYIHEEVLDQILEYSERDPTRELGGFLIGGLYQDAEEYVEIRHFLPAVDTRSRAASLTFTHDTWSSLNRRVDEQFPNDHVIGWHHTHPNFGIFLSAYDMFIHRHFFSELWQIAMVVDPQRQEFGFFQWRRGDIVDCGFVCVRNQEK